MASGSFVLTRTSGTEYLQGRVEWSSVSNGSAANSSQVTAKLIFKRTNTGYTTYGTGTFTLTIDGTTTSTGNISYSFTDTDKIIISASKTVAHNNDGTKSITISATYTGNSPIGGNGTRTVSLDSIPRYPTEPTSCTASEKTGDYDNFSRGTVRVAWSGSAGPITGYQVQRRVMPYNNLGNWGSWVAISTPSASPYNDAGMASEMSGALFMYRVRAMNGTLASGWTESNSLWVRGGVRTRRNNSWQSGTVWIRVGGTWRRAKDVWIRVGGTWRRSF